MGNVNPVLDLTGGSNVMTEPLSDIGRFFTGTFSIKKMRKSDSL